ncbi:MAG TPA: SGNH/GDSL hydrolase family protein [Terriglobia bacterium]|nr:SGNH/GDSL hydrolase family protein [Terriglobia bacterium]
MSRAKMLFALLALLCASRLVVAQNLPQHSNWVGTWATSEQIPEPHNALAPDDLRDATVRQIVHLTIGGKVLRVHLSNAFGTAPLRFDSVHIARAISPALSRIDIRTDRALTFAGHHAVTVPAGAEYISDPVDFPVAPEADLAITFYLSEPPQQETSHPGSRATSYLVHGNHVSDADFPGAKTFDHWFNIAGVDMIAPPGAAAVVTLGDSITDGHGATTNGNDRWPDDLARRLLREMPARHLSVLNQGIGGNRLLLDGLGPNALARFDRDVLAQPGVRYLIVLEGINDIGMFGRSGNQLKSDHESLVHKIIGAYQQIVLRAHAHGILVYGGTLLPFGDSTFYKPGALTEADWDAVNRWIRTPGHFDGVIDFAKVMCDPKHPHHLLPAYDSGDHLHPSPAGYRAMANAIPLSLFAK